MIKEIKGDLFNHCEQEDRIPVHCISADCVMGGGIAPLMVNHFKMSREKMRLMNPQVGTCLYAYGVLNMITKHDVCDSPSYFDFFSSLEDCKIICLKNHINKIVMPRIGCGIDGLDWTIVKRYITEVFGKTSIDVLICTL